MLRDVRPETRGGPPPNARSREAPSHESKMPFMTQPQIIQGGMGAGVSSWRLANAVAKRGQLGVVSGTALEVILVRRLQEGDPGGAMRRALAEFPCPAVAERILDNYFIPGGKAPDARFKHTPMHSLQSPKALLELTIAANFVEVFLAREGHEGVVGINYLEKIQLPNIPSLYGAMLAGVDYVLMGAGIPREIPGIIDRLAQHEEAAMTIYVQEAVAGETHEFRMDPKAVLDLDLPALKRPRFLAIVASASVAMVMQKKATGRVDGFVIEGPSAGGHNAPPRGKAQLNERGEPIFGPRDDVELEKIRELGLPFWLAGSYGTPHKLREALDEGACGIQIGTPFAFCQESGIAPEIRESVLRKVLAGTADVFTDPLASPTGFPFKVIQLEGTNSEAGVYEERPRICDLGFLRLPYRKEDGQMGYRCPAEPVDDYVRKGGRVEDTVGRKCLCNGLVSNIGHPQWRKNRYLEKPLLTAGYFLREIGAFLPKDGGLSYSAEDVIRILLEKAGVDSSVGAAGALSAP